LVTAITIIWSKDGRNKKENFELACFFVGTVETPKVLWTSVGSMVIDWGSCPGHQVRGTKEGRKRAKNISNLLNEKHVGAQSGNVAQGTRNHRSASAVDIISGVTHHHPMIVIEPQLRTN